MKKIWNWLLVTAIKHIDKDADGKVTIVVDLETKKVTIK